MTDPLASSGLCAPFDIDLAGEYRRLFGHDPVPISERLRDLPPLPPSQRGAIRYYRGDEPEYLAMKARWDADRAALVARWRRVYDPVLAAAPTTELSWAIKHHKPVFGYSDVGMPPRLPHCDCCTWGPDNEPEDWPCYVFRDLRAEVVRQRKR